jgi:glycosyltransferase involved in cell wall biosynthesis
MKIVYLHQYFNTPDTTGGTRSFEMARRWVEAGHEVHVVTTATEPTSDRGHLWTTTREAGAHVHWCQIPYDNAMGDRARMKAFLRFVFKAAPRARGLKGDVVFATSTPLTIILPALYATLFRRTPIVFEVRDLWPEIPIAVGRLGNPLLRFLARLLERVAYRSSRQIVALSEGMAAGVRATGIPADKIVVAPNSCDVEMFDVPSSTGVQYRASLPWLGTRPFIVYCGALGEINDVCYLVRLAARMRAVDPQVAFGIYGAGKEEAKVKTLATEMGVLDVNFFMMGEVLKKEMPSILSAATMATSVVLPMPELLANSANKFFDALAAGRPVAINHGGWQADILQSTGAGISLDPLDMDRAADQLNAFLQDPQQMAAARVAGRLLASDEFSRDRISGLVLRTIETAAGKHTPVVP